MTGFDSVREAFAAHPSDGSALCVLRDGEVVVDLHEGRRDAARTRPWDARTLVNVYSVGKPVIALAVLLLVERGLIGLDDPMARHWADFKAEVSVRQVLTHTSGLVTFPKTRDSSAWSDWELLCADLADAEQEWPPGTVAAEHALTYGHLLGELVRRVTGRDPGEFVSAEIARPWRLDFGFGLGAADSDRCAELVWGKSSTAVVCSAAPSSTKWSRPNSGEWTAISAARRPGVSGCRSRVTGPGAWAVSVAVLRGRTRAAAWRSAS
ncbi:serine hydrolase domain-containing protein [Winogradskya humida]|uniref:Beta-lactamase-related domain-containing protein n=1 Tax=Winogradskya humida TaxID=113566 RepID=A0ABQ3ZMV7_9ACTN|nr:serine hydrolase domain-containing protein [Actinoplanes humidus]GIE19915.1 hypothetical protein Ahu01nite_030170 [Actinoplanes humidus]